MNIMYIIGILLVTLCLLALIDLLQQYQIQTDSILNINYLRAVKWSVDFWKTGYRLEDLELKIDFQRKYWEEIKHQINVGLAPKFKIDHNVLRQNTHNFGYTRQSRITLHNLLQNDSAIYQIHCGTNGPLLRVGVNDFRTDVRDACQIHTATSQDPIGPSAMFEVVDLGDGSFAMRTLSNGRFVKTVPPPNDNARLPWKLVIGGHLIGSAERFRLEESGRLYSSLMGKYTNMCTTLY